MPPTLILQVPRLQEPGHKGHSAHCSPCPSEPPPSGSPHKGGSEFLPASTNTPGLLGGLAPSRPRKQIKPYTLAMKSRFIQKPVTDCRALHLHTPGPTPPWHLSLKATMTGHSRQDCSYTPDSQGPPAATRKATLHGAAKVVHGQHAQRQVSWGSLQITKVFPWCEIRARAPREDKERILSTIPGTGRRAPFQGPPYPTGKK